MKKNLLILALSLFSTTIVFSQIKLDKTNSYFSDSNDLQEENIEWYRFTVPENWDLPAARKITLALAVLKSKGESQNEPLVFIQGGPGGNTITEIKFWLWHPLREAHDIVLVDLRGTGFSEPRLCPDLGEKIFEILAKNQAKEVDIKDKVNIALECKQDLIDQGIDLTTYNSISVAKDLNALKNALKIDKWNIYGVSYGTFIAQAYAKIYPEDIHSLILDSPIANISDYYTYNTQNYLLSLDKLFKSCKENSVSNEQYPNLEDIYYANIAALEEHPLTVSVDKTIISTGEFTYNAEDYKIAIQQALYDKRLIEILPLLIYQFRDRNVVTLSQLVQAFSGALSLDYGTYFCFTCNEVIPFNNLEKYDSISAQNKKLNGGLSFYRSDFSVCEEWNNDNLFLHDKLNLQNENPFKLLILSGEFDPITPNYFAEETANNFSSNVEIITGYTYSHGLGYSRTGAYIVKSFLENKPIPDSLKYYFDKKNINFKTGITIKRGVVKMTGDINSKQWYYFIPLIISLVVILLVLIYSITQFFLSPKRMGFINTTLFLNSLTIISFLVFLSLGVNQTLKDNFYLLAFGLPSKWDFSFLLYDISIVLSAIVIIAILVKKIKFNIPLYFMILLAISIYHYYFLNWGYGF